MIIWGTKRVEKNLGTVADFCPICRNIRAFKLYRIGLAGHIYYISFGSGKLVGHLIQCLECGVRLSTDPLQYSSPDKRRVTDIDTLVNATYPKLREVYADRLTMEQQFKRTPSILTPEQRAIFLIEPFRLLNPSLEQRYKGSTQFGKQSGIGCLGTILLSSVIFVVAMNLKEPRQEQVLIGAGSVLCAGIIYTIVQLALEPRRYLHSQVIPTLARALDPLEPTEIELAACLEKCKMAEMVIGKKLKLDLLWAELQRCAASTPST